MTFRVLSWNINGLRSFKTEMKDFLSNLDADIICFQETKVTRDMLDEPLAIVEGYSSYFSFSRKRSGYSGVATFCSQSAAPIHAQEGLSGTLGGDLVDKGGTTEALVGHWTEEELKDLDSEGRAIITQHAIKGHNSRLCMVAVINVYCPRVDPEKPERRVYKLRFYELLRQRAAAIHATGCHVVIVGDVNASHKRIDHCDPDDSEVFELRLERKYLDKFLIPIHKEEDISQNGLENSEKEDDVRLHPSHSESDEKTSKLESTKDHKENLLDDSEYGEEGLADDHLLESASDFQVVDTFRYFNPHKKDAFTCWNTFTNARSTNYGTRIDYIFCDEMFIPCIEDSTVLQDVMGSDHCPVALRVKGEVSPSPKLPNVCTKFFPEFKGNQQKLSCYFQPVASIPSVRYESCGNQPQSGSKRKNTDRKVKSLSGKKSCSEKQIKLNSYFITKANTKTKGAGVISECDTNLKDDTSSSQTSVESCPSQSSAESFSQPRVNMSGETLDGDSICKSIATQNDNDNKIETSEKVSVSSSKGSGWGFLMKGPKPPPLCPGHKEPSAVRTVKKKGPNMNRQFYACPRGAGREGDPNAQCNFFQWVGKK